MHEASLRGRIRVEPGEASERVQARDRPTEGWFFGIKMARSAAEKRSRSERIPTEAVGVCDGCREGATLPLREAS